MCHFVSACNVLSKYFFSTSFRNPPKANLALDTLLKQAAKATYEKVKNEYELGKEHLNLEEEKNLREWIYGGVHEGAEIIKIITDLLPAGKAAKVFKTI